jgi:hypothetical protein
MRPATAFVVLGLLVLIAVAFVAWWVVISTGAT